MSDLDVLTDRTLLLLDDDAALRNRLGRALQSRGFTVTLAETVAEAMAAVAILP
jgi:two-component system response regulator RegA